jgi:flagellar motor switch protein FliM
MAAVLTQQEIDALLAGISAGTVEVDQLLKEQPKQILPYDFRRPCLLYTSPSPRDRG